MQKLHSRLSLATALLVAISSGCASTRKSDTARTGMEQLLISRAVDDSLSHVDFRALQGRSVFIDDKYLEAVDKGYIVGSMRHRTFASGARLVNSMEEADVVLEPRSGGVGTDSKESFIGIPGLGVPGMPIELPDIKLITRNTQYGTAKLSVVAYDPRTGTALGQGGNSLSRSLDQNWFVFGVGPFKGGNVHEELKDAGYGSDTDQIVKLSSGQPLQVARRPVPLVAPHPQPPVMR